MQNYIQKLKKSYSNQPWRYFLAGVLVVSLAKFVLLPFTAHPFDFWSFVNTFEQRVLYGWNPFEFWNKGNLLIVLWYPFYSLYLLVTNTAAQNVLLLHLFFKLPFFFIDLLSAYLIMRLVSDLFDKKSGRLAFWFWYLNPIIFYTYGIHGHYEILVPFSLLLVIFGVRKNNPWILASGFVIGFATKYFLLILAPLILIYLIINFPLKKTLLAIFFTLSGLFVSFVQLLIFPQFIEQMLSSVINLSKSNMPISVEKLSVPALNIISAVYQLFYPGGQINNLQNNYLFQLANKGVYIVAVIVIVHIIIRVLYILRSKEYPYKTFILDLIFTISYFLMFITNFQPHYLVWLAPLLIVYLFWLGDLLLVFSGMTMVGFIYTFKNEIGPQTFFLDNFDLARLNLHTLNNVEQSLMYLLGAFIIFLMLASLIIIYKNKNFLDRNSLTVIFLAANLICWLFIALTYLQAIIKYKTVGKNQQLLFAQYSRYHRGIIYANYPVESVNGSRVVFGQKNQVKSNLIDEVLNLPDSEKNNFLISLLYQGNNNDFYQMLDRAKLNECSLEKNYQSRDYYKPKTLPGYTANINCLQKENLLLLPEDADFVKDNLFLSVHNKDLGIPYDNNKRREITTLAAVAIVYLLLMLAAGYKIIILLKDDFKSKN